MFRFVKSDVSFGENRILKCKALVEAVLEVTFEKK